LVLNGLNNLMLDVLRADQEQYKLKYTKNIYF